MSHGLNIGCMLMGGPDYSINVGAKTYLFEMHPYCGPMPITKAGTERALGPKHEFWRAVSLWAEQGMRVENGKAVWSYKTKSDAEPMPSDLAKR